MRIVVTGADGFIGRNLCVKIAEGQRAVVVPLVRSTPDAVRRAALATADAVVHLAGVNRPATAADFEPGNTGCTMELCDQLRAFGRPVPIVFASSVQASLENPYGLSKLAAERVVHEYAAHNGTTATALRLPNVFGKWSRPNYNSAVATFCFNVARGLPITVADADAPLRLAYIDDVVEDLLSFVFNDAAAEPERGNYPVYETTVGYVAETIRGFEVGRRTRNSARVGGGLLRALYATYVSFLPVASFSYALERHTDARGVFAEILRTEDSGQFSFFSAHPGVTRGGHYHHTKTEKFLVIQGTARFGFRNLLTDERHEIVVVGQNATVVETVPGWVHDVTNVGNDELLVLLWANEAFDASAADTFVAPVTP
jgi:UDP-2-acetamido-2,6-beta-L-arabino-hexul-4-ose reductase